MLSGVPGLLTFTSGSEDVFERTSEPPTSVHVKTGSGLPDAIQNNVMLFLSTTMTVLFLISTDGGTEKPI